MARISVPRASLGVGVVGVVAGLLISLQATKAGDDPERAPTDLVSLARVQSERVEALEEEIEDLQEAIAPYLDQHEDGPRRASPEVRVAAGAAAVDGAGVQVSLTDAPVPETGIPPERVPDDYVVHQQDVEGVINALRAGGAEAIMIQGQRLLPTTSVRCVGNVLYVGTRVYSPPFVVAAVGDPDALTTALDASESVAIYRQWVDLIGLGYDVIVDDDLTIPPASAALRHAEPIEALGTYDGDAR